DALKRGATEPRLVPSARGEARNAEVDAPHLLGGAQLLHAGKSPPRPLAAARIAIDDPDIGDPFELEPERGGKSPLPAPDDQHIEHPRAAAIARNRPVARGIMPISQIAPHPIRKPGNAHRPP